MVDPYVDLVEKALKISPEIQFATVCNMLGVVKHRVRYLLYLTTTKNADHNEITSKATKLKLGKIKKIIKRQQEQIIA